MASITVGLAGGLVATIVMTIVMMVAGDAPPTASLVAKFAGSEPGDHAMPGMVLHLLYGTVAGGVFELGVPLVGFSLDAIGIATGLGLVYGILLMLVGMGFWMRAVIGMEPDRAMMIQLGIVHVVYGLVLGAFVGAGIIT